jgi:hypothetical protein
MTTQRHEQNEIYEKKKKKKKEPTNVRYVASTRHFMRNLESVETKRPGIATDAAAVPPPAASTTHRTNRNPSGKLGSEIGKRRQEDENRRRMSEKFLRAAVGGVIVNIVITGASDMKLTICEPNISCVSLSSKRR